MEKEKINWYKNPSGNLMFKKRGINHDGKFDTAVIKFNKECTSTFQYDVFFNGILWDSYNTLEFAKKDAEIWC